MRDSRSIYLHTVPVPEALSRIKHAIAGRISLGEELIESHRGYGRVTSRPVFARYSSPTYHSAAMDGICVRAEDTFMAREGHPLFLKKTKDFLFVNTGDPIPSGFNAVIMIEDVEEIDNETVKIEKSAYPWQHVRKIGEDIVATEMLIPQNHLLSAYDIGALLSAGIFEIYVKEKVKIAIIPTGDEVVDFLRRPIPGPGEVIESNSSILACMAPLWGCDLKRYPPVPDDMEMLCSVVKEALESEIHILILGAGSSAGTKDYSRRVMERFGEVLVHGISTMPGKPSILGVAGGKILVGAPGYPVSAVVCFEELIRPLVYWIQNLPLPKRERVLVRLTRDIPSRLGQEELVRVCIGKVGKSYVASPLKRGASLITSLTRAQGIVRIPQNMEGIPQAQEVEAELICPRSQIDRILICVGSHDNILDLLANELMGLSEPIQLSSTHVGSMGGLMAIKKKSCHFAGSHLYDPESEDYNFPFLHKYIPDIKVEVINLAIRHQGLMVSKGNPKNIKGVEDLVREDITFINRQRGSGTRILFDDLIKKKGIGPSHIKGYEREEYTHMGVGVNVLSGSADVGMGIFAAARALNLDFIPICRERYDLIIPQEFSTIPKILKLKEILNSASFKKRIEGLGGYEIRFTGKKMVPGITI